MDKQLIVSIRNAAEEYRRLAAGLSEVFDKLKGHKRDGLLCMPDFIMSVNSIETQIGSLKNKADLLENIAANYEKAGKALSDLTWMDDTSGLQTEFGISEFANLAKHEKLMPIHRD